MRGLRLSIFGFLGGLAALTMMAATAPAPAQTPRSSVDMQTSQPVPQFRDPKTGQIWTPLNVGLQSGPPTPQDLAFDPLGQAVYVKGVVTQRPSIVPLSSVPITAGPTVPIVNIGDATLSAIPGKRWQVVLYLQNNSANTVVPLINCRFRRLARRHDRQWTENRPVRRPRQLRREVALVWGCGAPARSR